MIEKDPILITGIPRSGASTVAKIINACGAFAGNMSQEKGRYQNDRIRDTVVKSFLNLSGLDPEGQYPLRPTQKWIPGNFRTNVEKIMKDEGYVDGNWMYKDHRMILMHDVFNYAFPNAKWIIVRRRSGDIVESCMQTAYMSAFKNLAKQKQVQVNSEREGWLWMIHQYEDYLVKMIQDGLNCKVVWPERMARGDFRQLYDTLDWLGLAWKNEVIEMMSVLVKKQ